MFCRPTQQQADILQQAILAWLTALPFRQLEVFYRTLLWGLSQMVNISLPYARLQSGLPPCSLITIMATTMLASSLLIVDMEEQLECISFSELPESCLLHVIRWEHTLLYVLCNDVALGARLMQLYGAILQALRGSQPRQAVRAGAW